MTKTITNYKFHPEVGRLWFKLHYVAGFETRIVGGAVRDWVMGQEPKDIDFCTTATPEQMIQFADENKFRIEPTGMQHGTVSFIIDGVAYEFTTLRVDTDCDGRHATVQFTTDFEADAARRDFTFNAMSMDIDGKVYDYFGGVADAESKTVRFVGNASDRIAEDYLRVLRFFRFAARYDAKMDPAALESFRAQAVHDGLKAISRERIWAEVSKIATAKGRKTAIAWMVDCGIATAIGMKPNQFATKAVNRADDAASFMAGFCGTDPYQFSIDWKMSRDEAKKMTFVFMESSNTTRDIVEMCLDGFPRDWIVSVCAMHKTDCINMVDANWPKFTVTGKDLIAEGFVPGKDLGDELDRRRKAWKQTVLKGI